MGLRYCGLSISFLTQKFLQTQFRKLFFLIDFPIEQFIREIPVFDITYLSSYRKGQG